MMGSTLVLASFLGSLFSIITHPIVAFIAGTALILILGGPAWLALTTGIVAGVGAYIAQMPSPRPPVPPQPEYRISIDFSPGQPYTIPFECKIHNVKTIKDQNPSAEPIKSIRASNGKEFEVRFNNYLKEELKPLSQQAVLRSITIYEDPFPGETPIDMIYNSCKDQFPDVELHTTQEAYHD